MFDNFIPLSVLAGEHHSTVDGLAYHLGNKVIVHNGIRCVEVEVAVAMCDQREARKQAASERRNSAPANNIQARVSGIARNQKELREAGLLDDSTPSIAVVCGPEHEAGMTRRGNDFDRLKRATPDNAGFGATFGGISQRNGD